MSVGTADGWGTENNLSDTQPVPSKPSANEDKHDFFETNQFNSAITVLIENALTLGELFIVLQSRQRSARIFKTARDNTESDWCLYVTSGPNVPRTYNAIPVTRDHFWGLVTAVLIVLVILGFFTLCGRFRKPTEAGEVYFLAERSYRHGLGYIDLTEVKNALKDKGVNALDKVIKKREDANPHVVLLESKQQMDKGPRGKLEKLVGEDKFVFLNGISIREFNEGYQSVNSACKSSLDASDRESITCSSMSLEGDLAYVLYWILDRNPQLRTLDIAENELGDDGVRKLVPALEKMKEIEWLDLSGNKLGVAGVTALVPALENMTKLKQLNLTRNRIDDDGVRLLLPDLEKKLNYEIKPDT